MATLEQPQQHVSHELIELFDRVIELEQEPPSPVPATSVEKEGSLRSSLVSRGTWDDSAFLFVLLLLSAFGTLLFGIAATGFLYFLGIDTSTQVWELRTFSWFVFAVWAIVSTAASCGAIHLAVPTIPRWFCISLGSGVVLLTTALALTYKHLFGEIMPSRMQVTSLWMTCILTLLLGIAYSQRRFDSQDLTLLQVFTLLAIVIPAVISWGVFLVRSWANSEPLTTLFLALLPAGTLIASQIFRRQLAKPPAA